MSEENQEKDNLTLEAIDKALAEKLNKGFEKFQTDLDAKLDSKLDAKFKKSDEPEKNQWNLDEEEENDDDAVVTKADLKKILSEVKKDVVLETDSILAQKQKDAEVLVHFPLLNPQSELFNKEFADEVRSEVTRKVRSGMSNKHPDLINDAAAVIENKWIRSGKYIPQNLAEKLSQSESSNASPFGGKFNSKSTSKAPNATQLALAEQLGVNKDFLSQHIKNIK